MTTRFIESVVGLWDAEGLDASFPGGIHVTGAPSGVAFPYVVYDDLGNETTGYTSANEIRNHNFEFRVFYKDAEDGTDPISALGTLMRTINNSYKLQADLNLPSSSGNIIEFRRVTDRIVKDPEIKNVWQGQIEYRCLRSIPRPAD